MITRRNLEKKGAAHLEMIISFLFFIGFVFFLFTVLQPYDMTTLSGSVVAGLYDSFEEKTHTNISNVFLEASYTGASSCFYVQLPESIFEYDITNSLVKSVSETKIESKFQNGNLNLGSKEGYYKVSFSPEFESGNLEGCEQVLNYSVGSLVERRLSSYSSLVSMSDKYTNDYEGLKQDLNVPAAFDFGITCNELPELNMERLIPNRGNVVARDYILEVLKDTGETINARFTIKAW